MGFVWPTPNYLYGLDKMSRVLDRLGIDLHFLPGNHEDHTKLELLTRRAKLFSTEGHAQFRPRLFYTGRVSTWVWGGRRMAAVGGATSIDKENRLRYKRETGTDIWWPQEVLSPEEIGQARDIGWADVLFTHDAPVLNPFKLKEDFDSHVYRQMINSVGLALRPKLWFHGHYHESASYSFRHDDGFCEVRSLGRDNQASGWCSVLRLSSAREEASCASA
jgi:hypothetical protein